MIKLFYNIVDHQNAVRVTIRINPIQPFVLVCITMKHEKVHVSQQFFLHYSELRIYFKFFNLKRYLCLKMIYLGHLSKVVLESKNYVHQYQLHSLNVLIIVTVGKS